MREAEREVKELIESAEQAAKESGDQYEALSSSGSGSSGNGSFVDEEDNSGSGSGTSGSGNSNSGPGNNNEDDDDFDDDDDDDDDFDDDDDSDDDDDDNSGRGNAEYPDYDRDGHAYRANEYVLITDRRDTVRRLQRAGFRVISSRRLSRLGLFAVRVQRPRGLDEQEGLNALRRVVPDTAAGYNHYYRPSGPALSKRPVRNAPESRSANRTVSSIGVIDSFPSADVEQWLVRSFVNRAGTDYHGEQVSYRLIDDLHLHHNATPRNLYLGNVVERLPTGGNAASLEAMVLAMDWMAVKKTKIINLSLSGPDNPVLQRAIERLAEREITVIAAAGNVGAAADVQYPAGYTETIAVTAIDAQGTPYLYAPRGDHIDFSAVGVNLPDQTTGTSVSGTSFAAPRVAAEVSMLKKQRRVSVRDRLASTAIDLGEPGKDPVYGYGVVGPMDAP
jgi:hypothetical protein